MKLLLLFTAAFAAYPFGVSRAQSAAEFYRGDSVFATAMHHDSASRLTLTTRAVVYEYTAKGITRMTGHADSLTSGYSDRSIAASVRRGMVDGLRNMHAAYDLRYIIAASATGRTILIQFRKPSNGSADDQFDFDCDDAAAAAAFVDRLNELIKAR